MNWTVHPETTEFNEFHECDVGRVERIPEGWKALVYIPEEQQRGHAKVQQVGDVYGSSGGARSAVIRAYRKFGVIE